jgi:hypothetical protein
MSAHVNQPRGYRVLVPAFFLVVTLVMTYPLALHLGTGVRDLGDGLLNSWTMAWDVREITRLDFAHFFDANIFYPNKRTLAYSENLFTQALASLPVRIFSSNPLLAHNVVLLLAYLTSALGMYALARHLTQSRFGGVVAGLVYGFSPFMFSHFVHIQVVTAGGIPLAFLFLHRYFETGRAREAVFFALAASFQALANGYYALYLGLFGGIFILVMAVAQRKISEPRFWRDMLAAAAVVLVLVGPFAYQYVQVGKDMNFFRNIGSPASLTSFLAASPTNRLYGALTQRFQVPEKHLFPGAVAFILFAVGLASLTFVRRPSGRGPSRPRGTSPARSPRLLAAVYGSITLLAFLFTFGPHGPYVLLHRYVPGFIGLRVPARFQVFVMFGIAVLAAFGAKSLAAKLRAKKRGLAPLVLVALPLLILAEYAAFPLPLEDFPPDKAYPEVYKWLAARNDDGAVLELPLPTPRFGIGLVECPRQFYSTLHWHNLVNGYSGFFPPVYDELLVRWREYPIEQNIRDARELGVRYLIVHGGELAAESVTPLASYFATLAPEVREAGRFGKDLVYVLAPAPASQPSHGALAAAASSRTASLSLSSDLVPIRPSPGWRATSNVNAALAHLAIDHDRRTRWASGLQKPGDNFELDMGDVREIAGLSLKLGPSTLDYPRGCAVELSSDGRTWTEAARLDTPLLPIRAYLTAADISYEIAFPRQPARYVRLTLTTASSRYYWSIYEIEALDDRRT